jgi:anti-sigma regulatory factor (Ser/Thr protein kinase)
MSLSPEETEILDLMKAMLPTGLSGYPADFLSWIKMEYKKKGKPYSSVSMKSIENCLTVLKAENIIEPNKNDPKEFCGVSSVLLKNWVKDSYEIYGAFEFSPIQYVRSRLESFLKINNVSEDDLVDVSIATIEAIENAAKYGDGNSVFVSCNIQDKKLQLEIINKIKDVDLETELLKKYTSATTLMKGVMVMQKLFNHVDLQILEETQQAKLYAEKLFA